MKKYSFFIAALFLLSACNVSVKRTDSETTATDASAATTAEQSPVAAKVTDPVCNMEKGSDWTEYTVNGKDTIWFCSPHCKETYAKNPEKYQGKQEDKKG